MIINFQYVYFERLPKYEREKDELKFREFKMILYVNMYSKYLI